MLAALLAATLPANTFAVSGKAMAAFNAGRYEQAVKLLTPEAEAGGPLAKLREGDVVRLDSEAGTLEALVDAAEWEAREPATADLSANDRGLGRDLFAHLRRGMGEAEAGGSLMGDLAA